MKNDRDKFWETRSKCYEKLEWATKSGYLHSFLDAGDFNHKDKVLDIGSGTGIISHTLSPHVHKAVGIDISKDMLSHALNHKVRNETFMLCDARKLPFPDSAFSKVTARMVFHHIIENTQKAMDECFRVLKNGGRMVFSEGVPPSEHVKKFYVDMFKYKEDRLTFMEKDLEQLMQNSGFKITKNIIHWNKKSSIKNWLENSGLPKETQDKILRMHIDLDNKGKIDYNMLIQDNDCYIDMKFVILAGEKE